MSERDRGLYSFVRFPLLYQLFQNALGAERYRHTIVSQLVQPEPGMTILDVGCGPGVLFPHLSNVSYTGFDLNAAHIQTAQSNYPAATFRVGNVVTDLDLPEGSFDRVIALGLLHHLDDADAKALVLRLVKLLRQDGRVVTVDPTFVEHQHPAARLLARFDSGRHVRSPAQYTSLCPEVPTKVRCFNDLLRVPYDHCAMVIDKPSD